jgi:hypothetical protein
MSDDRRAVLVAIAYGNDPAIRPAERLQALELLDRMPFEDEWEVFREELRGLSGEELQLGLDAVVSTVFAITDEAERRRKWPATMAALDAAVDQRVVAALATMPPAPVFSLVPDTASQAANPTSPPSNLV